MRQTLDDTGTSVSPTGYAYTPFGVVRSGAEPAPFGFTGELQSDDLVYLRARWYDPASGTLLGRDPFAGFERVPYSLHPYQYAYSDPIRYIDPTGRVGCASQPEQCAVDGHDGWYETNPEQGRRDSSIVIDFIPVAGDLKAFGEVFTGCDLLTGDDLGWWRYAGLLPILGPRLRKLRLLRHLGSLPLPPSFFRHTGSTAGGSWRHLAPHGDEVAVVIQEEGGIANSIITGLITRAEQRRLARYIAKRHGTRVVLRSSERSNLFDGPTNTVHIRHSRDDLPRGVYYEEIQHALDFHAGRYEGISLPNRADPTFHAKNTSLHIITFRTLAQNEHGWFDLTQEQIEGLLRQADEWESSLHP